MLRRRLPLLLVFALLFGATPAAAQSVASVVDQMRAQYERQLDAVDTYIVETTLYTSYNKKVMRDGSPTYESQTRMKGQSSNAFASSTTPTTVYGLQFDRLKEHATYQGTETVNGVRTHVLHVDDPSAVNPDVSTNDAESMTYYIDAERSVPTRILMKPEGQGAQGPQASSVTINMKDYRTTDGLTLPYRMEFQIDMNMSEAQRKQMEKAMKQMENMPEAQRKQMESMMGSQMEMMKQMMSGEPMIVEVQRVQVNTELPDGMFN